MPNWREWVNHLHCFMQGVPMKKEKFCTILLTQKMNTTVTEFSSLTVNKIITELLC